MSDAAPAILPVPPSSLVGRTALVADAVKLIGGHRVVTMLGPGGVGKTRMLQAMFDTTEEGIGVFQNTSRWKGAYEGFRFEARGEEVRAVYPQSGDKEKFSARARKCNERGMDFCLDVSGTSRGTKRYYSREGWELNSIHDEEHCVTSLLQSAPQQ